MDGKSLDLTAEKLQQLKALFPEVFSEDKIDFQRLKIALGENVIDSKEHYELSWAGKMNARAEIQKQTTATLVMSGLVASNENPPLLPAHSSLQKHSFIEGENLEVLRILQKSYFGKVKMIYIDPPYNTGNDSFVYPDSFEERQKDYKSRAGKTMENGNLNSAGFWQQNTKENGHFHSNWLSMMYPRLYLSRNLLREDGVIFISIDDNEASNLKLLCDEIFGEENFIGDFVWRRKVGAGADAKLFFRQHEHIYFYAKNIQYIKDLFQPLTNEQKKEYANPDNDPRGEWASTDLGSPAHDNDPKRIYPVTSPTGKVFEKCWSYTRENFGKLLEQNLIWWGSEGNSMPKRKRFLNDKQGLTPRSWIDNILTQDGRKDLENIGLSDFFDYPKPIKLIKHFLSIVTNPTENHLILDFFAGSGTAAQAVMELNEEDGGNRQFICVQMPEPTAKNSEAYKAGYKTIADITKARIEKVVSKIVAGGKQKKKANTQKIELLQQKISKSLPSEEKESIKAEIQDLENQNQEIQVRHSTLATRYYTLAPSNFKVWQSDIKGVQAIATQLFEHQQSEKQTDEQDKFFVELCLKSGLGLSPNYVVKVLTDNLKVYQVEKTKVWFCFDKYNTVLKEAILAQQAQKIVMLNSCFEGDVALINFQFELKENGVELTII